MHVSAPENMAWVSGGAFLMGSEDFYPEERPVHPQRVDGFWMDRHPVTVEEFQSFVEATGHVTTAEIAPDAVDFPEADPAQLVAGSLVFVPPVHRVSLDDFRAWWAWVPGAQWRHPEGPGSTVMGREQHPVTHVAYADAFASVRPELLPAVPTGRPSATDDGHVHQSPGISLRRQNLTRPGRDAAPCASRTKRSVPGARAARWRAQPP